jgi:hypothetical protein
MGEEMSKAEVLEAMRSARQEWDALISRIPSARMTEPGVMGDGSEWTVKDVIYHVLWGEREIIEVFRQHKLTGSDLWDLPQTERNTAMVEEGKHLSLDEVLSEAQQVYAQLVAEIEKLSDEDLNDASLYEDMPPDWKPWRLIAENTFEHYPEHLGPISAWLEKPESEEQLQQA